MLQIEPPPHSPQCALTTVLPIEPPPDSLEEEEEGAAGGAHLERRRRARRLMTALLACSARALADFSPPHSLHRLRHFPSIDRTTRARTAPSCLASASPFFVTSSPSCSVSSTSPSSLRVTHVRPPNRRHPSPRPAHATPATPRQMNARGPQLNDRYVWVSLQENFSKNKNHPKR